MLAKSSRWHRQGSFWAYTMMDAKYWDQIAEGYLILNTDGKCEWGLECSR
jgi:hypothetical protein